jgi:hypothetical protein
VRYSLSRSTCSSDTQWSGTLLASRLRSSIVGKLIQHTVLRYGGREKMDIPKPAESELPLAAVMGRISSIGMPPGAPTYFQQSGEALVAIEPLSRLNILVGANNTGKSRFIRHLSNQPGYDFKLRGSILESTLGKLTPIFDAFEGLLRGLGQTGADDLTLESIVELRKQPLFFNTQRDPFEGLRSRLLKWSQMDTVRRWEGYSEGSSPTDSRLSNVPGAVRGLASSAQEIVNSIPKIFFQKPQSRVYIPSIRGLRPLDAGRSDFYQTQTQENYFKGVGSVPDIFSGLGMYDRLMRMLLGPRAQRNRIADYQEFLSHELFNDEPVTLIPSLEEATIVVRIGSEPDRAIHDLGDGIQQVIILTFLPFTADSPTFFFIEEPELHLHPGLQRKILQYYSKCIDHMFFITTHSNHLLDVCIDIDCASIFAFRKHFRNRDSNADEVGRLVIEAVSSSCDNTLRDLGVRNSSVFLVNATIWVEGITDRWYLRAMLESYKQAPNLEDELPRRMEEDVHYSFVEYGGANITHWSFLSEEEHPIEIEALCSKAILIVDGDGDAKLKRKAELAKKLGDRFVLLPCREIENLLNWDVIRSVVRGYEGADIIPIPDLEYESYANKHLGKFIEEDILSGGRTRKGSYAEASGTLTDKVKFCEQAVPHIKYEALPPTSQDVVRRIYDFILKQNG